MEQLNDIIFWKQVSIVTSSIIIIAAIAERKRIWRSLRKSIMCDRYNLQVDYNEYYDFLKNHPHPDIEKINEGIEEFRKYHEKKVPKAIVSSYVKSLYDIHKYTPTAEFSLS